MKYRTLNTSSYIRIKVYLKGPFAARRTCCTKYQINHEHCKKSPESKLNLGMSLSQAFRPVKRITSILYSSKPRMPIGGAM
jgi:hypothetical protein